MITREAARKSEEATRLARLPTDHYKNYCFRSRRLTIDWNNQNQCTPHSILVFRPQLQRPCFFSPPGHLASCHTSISLHIIGYTLSQSDTSHICPFCSSRLPALNVLIARDGRYAEPNDDVKATRLIAPEPLGSCCQTPNAGTMINYFCTRVELDAISRPCTA